MNKKDGYIEIISQEKTTKSVKKDTPKVQIKIQIKNGVKKLYKIWMDKKPITKFFTKYFNKMSELSSPEQWKGYIQTDEYKKIAQERALKIILILVVVFTIAYFSETIATIFTVIIVSLSVLMIIEYLDTAFRDILKDFEKLEGNEHDQEE